MTGIAEGLPGVLRWVVRRGEIPPESSRRVERWLERGELPSLPALAGLLEHWGRGTGFADLELLCSGRRGLGDEGAPLAKVSPRLLVSRLDVGLRCLRAEKGATQAAVAVGAGLDQKNLSEWERPETGERPSIAELDRVLQVLGASYLDLERSLKNPQRALRALRRREERELPMTIGGKAPPEIVSARFDLALRVLRLRRGWSRRELGKRSGVGENRIQALERPRQGKPPGDQEVTAVLEALGASLEDLVQGAENPLRPLEQVQRELRKLHRERQRRGPTVIAGVKVPGVVTERFDLALQVLRSRKGWSRRVLAERAGLAPERVVALETLGRSGPPTAAEVKALRLALEATAADFEDAARYPLRGAARLGRQLRRLERKLEARNEELDRALAELEGAREKLGEPSGPVFESAWRLARSIERVRESLAERK